MKKFAYGAIALAAVGAAGQATDTGWSGLDQEINSLSASLATQNATGPKVGGYIITSLDYTSDVADGEEDVLGWDFRNVRLQVSGDLGHDYSYKVSFDLAGSSVEGTDINGDAVEVDLGGFAYLKDAYVDWKITDGIKGRWGQYKIPFLRSGLISKQKLLFLQRTLIGEVFGERGLGFAVSGQFEMVNFWVNAQNGVDGITKDMFYNARVTFDVMGDGVAMLEGAYGAGDALGLTVGGAIGEDSALEDGMVWGLEAALTSGPFSVAAEIANIEAGYIDVAFDGSGEDITPWNATASFMFSDQYELAARYEDLDDPFDSTVYTIGVNRYVAGHDIKWTLQYQMLDTDLADEDLDTISLGLTVGF